MNYLTWLPPYLGERQDVLDLLKSKGCDGLLINLGDTKGNPSPAYDAITKANLKDFPRSMLNVGGSWRSRMNGYKDYMQFIDKFYIGEPKTENYWGSAEVEEQFYFVGPTKYLCDEPSILKLEEYKILNCDVTYSSYRKYWVFLEKLFGIRWPRWGNQVFAWEWLNRNYNGALGSHITTISPYRFKDCWINLRTNQDDFGELINWCKSHNKRVMLYVEWDMSIEEFTRLLDKFVKYL